MAQLEHIEVIEKRLWNAADTLPANCNYASNEYFMPVMGLISLRHAYNRYFSVKKGIEGSLPKRGGRTCGLTRKDFSQKSDIYRRLRVKEESGIPLNRFLVFHLGAHAINPWG